MKATGIVRPVDPLGRVVIPKELRSTMDIGSKDGLEIFVDGDAIVLKKYVPGCDFCGQVEKDMFEFGGKKLCHSCKAKISQALRENR